MFVGAGYLDTLYDSRLSSKCLRVLHAAMSRRKVPEAQESQTKKKTDDGESKEEILQRERW